MIPHNGREPMSLMRTRYTFILAIMLSIAAVLAAFVPAASSADTPVKGLVGTPVQPGIINGVINPNINIRLAFNPLVRGFLVADPATRSEITGVSLRPQLAKSIYLP